MDVLVAGPHGPLMRWTSALVAAAVAMVHPALENASADDTWTPRAAPPDAVRLFTAEYVSESYAAAVATGAVHTVLVLDEPASCFHVLRTAGHESIPVLRRLIYCATSLGELATCPGALTLARDGGRDAGQTLLAVLDHFDLVLDDTALADLAARFGIAGPGIGLDAVLLCFEASEVVHPVLAPADDAMVRVALMPAFGYGATGRRRKVAWPRACLSLGDRPDVGPPAPLIVEITGPARILVYGPYFYLAAGRWRMSATLAFSPSARGVRLALGLFGPNSLGGCCFTVERAGVFAASTIITVPSAREALEIRLMVERGAIEGELGIDSVTFDPELE